jgi:hypothetical protein
MRHDYLNGHAWHVHGPCSEPQKPALDLGTTSMKYNPACQETKCQMQPSAISSTEDNLSSLYPAGPEAASYLQNNTADGQLHSLTTVVEIKPSNFHAAQGTKSCHDQILQGPDETQFMARRPLCGSHLLETSKEQYPARCAPRLWQQSTNTTPVTSHAAQSTKSCQARNLQDPDHAQNMAPDHTQKIEAQPRLKPYILQQSQRMSA